MATPFPMSIRRRMKTSFQLIVDREAPRLSEIAAAELGFGMRSCNCNIFHVESSQVRLHHVLSRAAAPATHPAVLTR